MPLTPSAAALYTDHLALWYHHVFVALGDGQDGASQQAWTLLQAVLASNDYDQVDALLRLSRGLYDASLADTFAAGTASGFLSALNNLAARAGISGVSDLNSFATYYNLQASTKWQCLFAPLFRHLYGLWRGGNYPSAHNVYFEVLQGSRYPNALRKLVVGGSQTAGATIPDTQYAGGFPFLKWSGVSGSGTATITGNWRKTDGTTATGNGSANVSGASGEVAITPPFTGALILSCTNISTSGITAGTLYVEARRPSGRIRVP